MGASTAAGYALAFGTENTFRVWKGVAFGVFVWIVADEIAMPLLGFSKRAAKIPKASHLYALLAHIVYGLVTIRLLSSNLFSANDDWKEVST
jgi:uncharacterized membrane protein YagU involved in acid resistance